jgi:CheY-like chemotaxis protein
LKITVISRDERQLADLMRLLRARSPSDEIDHLSGGVARTAATDEHMPDVLIVDRPQVADDDLEQLERFSTQHPNIACVALCIDQDPQFLLQAMRAGVREVLPSPSPAARCIRRWSASPKTRTARPDQRQGAGLHLLQGRQRRHLPRHQPGYALAASGKQGGADRHEPAIRRRLAVRLRPQAAGHAERRGAADPPPRPVVPDFVHAQHHAQLRRAGGAVRPGARQRRQARPHRRHPQAGAPPVRLRGAGRGPQPGRGQHPRARPCRHDFPHPANHPALHPRQQAPAQRVPLARIRQGEDPADRQPPRQEQRNPPEGSRKRLRRRDRLHHAQQLRRGGRLGQPGRAGAAAGADRAAEPALAELARKLSGEAAPVQQSGGWLGKLGLRK